MSTKHLTIGSQDPPRVDGLLRIYGMKFCPYVLRALLVLKAKQIPHEVVYINLFKKPEWYFKVHPEGKVPALVDGSNVIVESLYICDYLDQKYPENPMYPAEPAAKNKDNEVIKLVDPVSQALAKCTYTEEMKSPEDCAKLIVSSFQNLEKELASRGTKFFRGDRPGMVDYMLWPWTAQPRCIEIQLGSKLPFKDDDIPLIRQWEKDMNQHPICQEFLFSGERQWKIVSCKLNGSEPLYDEI